MHRLTADTDSACCSSGTRKAWPGCAFSSVTAAPSAMDSMVVMLEPGRHCGALPPLCMPPARPSDPIASDGCLLFPPPSPAAAAWRGHGSLGRHQEPLRGTTSCRFASASACRSTSLAARTMRACWASLSSARKLPSARGSGSPAALRAAFSVVCRCKLSLQKGSRSRVKAGGCSPRNGGHRADVRLLSSGGSGLLVGDTGCEQFPGSIWGVNPEICWPYNRFNVHIALLCQAATTCLQHGTAQSLCDDKMRNTLTPQG